jgi:signal transduction histidine kinase
MLHEFLNANRVELIERCRVKVARRRSPDVTDAHLEHGIPLFIGQLIRTLRLEQTSESLHSRRVSGAPGGGGNSGTSEISGTAAQHGRELFQHGFTVEQVVHDYGDLCQAITELASEYGKPIQTDEFHTLNRCLDNAIAGAVTEYSFGQNVVIAEQGVQALNERLGFLAHELRNHVHTASLALIAIKSRHVGVAGATGAVLERSLTEIRSLVDRSLADVRVTAGLPAIQQLISLADFVSEIKVSAALEAQGRECVFTVTAVDPLLAIEVDRHLLGAAVGNLLQNAFKFTRHRSNVTLRAYASADRILIEVEDTCGGLPPGTAENMFQPFAQSHSDRSGLGLGLSISRRSVEANNGKLGVRDIPGSGCVFTIDLPRHSLPASAGVSAARVVAGDGLAAGVGKAAAGRLPSAGAA